MIKPQPLKFVCSKCGYSKIVKPKSDALNLMDFLNTCPKCSSKMKKESINLIDNIKDLF